jgi:hypothetical protein
MNVRAKAASAGIAAVVIGGSVAVSVPSASAHHRREIRHVLLISVDGMHQSDLNWYIRQPPELRAREACLRGRGLQQQPYV